MTKKKDKHASSPEVSNPVGDHSGGDWKLPWEFTSVCVFFYFSMTEAALADGWASRGWGVPGQGVVQQRLQ